MKVVTDNKRRELRCFSQLDAEAQEWFAPNLASWEHHTPRFLDYEGMLMDIGNAIHDKSVSVAGAPWAEWRVVIPTTLSSGLLLKLDAADGTAIVGRYVA